MRLSKTMGDSMKFSGGSIIHRILITSDDVTRVGQLCAALESCALAATCSIETCAIGEVVSRVMALAPDILFVDVDSDRRAGGGISAIERLQARMCGSAAGAFGAARGVDCSSTFAGTRVAAHTTDGSLAACPQVIYFANRENYTSAVYQTDHCYLLMEPFSADAVVAALNRAMSRRRAEFEMRPATLTLRCAGTLHILQAHEIAFIESAGRKVIVTCVNGKKYETYATLADIEKSFALVFVRCHKQFLVNLEHIVRMEGSDLCLSTGDTIPVSQRRLAVVREAVMGH